MNEAVNNVLLQSLMVIFHILSPANFKGIVAVRENDGGKLMFIVYQMAAMKVRNRNVVFTPEGQANIWGTTN